MDVPTPSTIPMWEPILDTLFRTLKDDQLCSTVGFEAIWGKTVHSGYPQVSFISDQLWQTRGCSIAQPDHAGMERSTQDKVGSANQRMYFGIHCLKKTED